MAAKKKAMDPRPTPPPKKTKLQTETSNKMSEAQKRRQSTPDTQTEAIKKVLTFGRELVKSPGKYIPYLGGRSGLASIMEKEMSKGRKPVPMRNITPPNSNRKPASLKMGTPKPKSNKKY